MTARTHEPSVRRADILREQRAAEQKVVAEGQRGPFSILAAQDARKAARWNIRRSDLRPMTAQEAENLRFRVPVQLLDTHTQEIYEGSLYSFKGDAINVKLPTGHIVGLDLDDPDFWGDDEKRERRPPMSDDGQFVAVMGADVPIPEPEADPELFDAIRASIQIGELRAEVAELRSGVADLKWRLLGEAP